MPDIPDVVIHNSPTEVMVIGVGAAAFWLFLQAVRLASVMKTKKRHFFFIASFIVNGFYGAIILNPFGIGKCAR